MSIANISLSSIVQSIPSQPFSWNSVYCIAASGPAIDPSSGWLGLIVALMALAAMEIVLGIDNIIFISIATSRLPAEQQNRARLIGLALAMFLRVGLLCFIAAIASWTQPLFQLSAILPASLRPLLADASSINEVSLRDLILLGGGLFLIYQSVKEMHHLTEPESPDPAQLPKTSHSFGKVLFQIAMLDIVFSLDSVITAVGMVDNIAIMIAAVMIAVLSMMFFAGAVSTFVMRHPSVKVLALAFLLMIGVVLVAEGFGTHFNKNYIYFAMAFSLGVELLNLRLGRGKAVGQ